MSESNSSTGNGNSTIYRTLTITSSTLDILLGLPPNGYVLWLILTSGTMAADIFDLHLAISEIIICLLAISVLVAHIVPSVHIMTLSEFSSAFSCTARPMFQCCICVERYLAVVHPLVFFRCKPLRYRVVCSSVVWLVMVVLSLCISLIPRGENIIPAQYLVFLVVMSFCCLAVLRALKQPGPGDGERDRDGLSDQKRRAFKIILINLVFTVLTYLPVSVLMPITLHFDLPIYSLSLFFILISGFVTPVLYLHRIGKLPFIPF